MRRKDLQAKTGFTLVQGTSRLTSSIGFKLGDFFSCREILSRLSLYFSGFSCQQTPDEIGQGESKVLNAFAKNFLRI